MHTVTGVIGRTETAVGVVDWIFGEGGEGVESWETLRSETGVEATCLGF